MTTDGATAIGRFTLRERGRPEYDSYQLRFADLRRPAERAAHPLSHRRHPRLAAGSATGRADKMTVQLPENGRLAIKVRAEDPDFALRRRNVAGRARRPERARSPRCWIKRSPRSRCRASLRRRTRSKPAKLRLKAGDRVQYWAEAEDNKEPTAGRSATDRQWIEVVSSEGRRQAQQPPEGGAGQSGAARQSTAASRRIPASGFATDGCRSARAAGVERRCDNQAAAGRGSAKEGRAGPTAARNARQGRGQTAVRFVSIRPRRRQIGFRQIRPSMGTQQGGNQSANEEQSGQPSEKIDPKTDPGGAMQENPRRSEEGTTKGTAKEAERREARQRKQSGTQPQSDSQQQQQQQGTQQQQQGAQQQQNNQQQGTQQQQGRPSNKRATNNKARNNSNKAPTNSKARSNNRAGNSSRARSNNPAPNSRPVDNNRAATSRLGSSSPPDNKRAVSNRAISTRVANRQASSLREPRSRAVRNPMAKRLLPNSRPDKEASSSRVARSPLRRSPTINNQQPSRGPARSRPPARPAMRNRATRSRAPRSLPAIRRVRRAVTAR